MSEKEIDSIAEEIVFEGMKAIFLSKNIEPVTKAEPDPVREQDPVSVNPKGGLKSKSNLLNVQKSGIFDGSDFEIESSSQVDAQFLSGKDDPQPVPFFLRKSSFYYKDDSSGMSVNTRPPSNSGFDNGHDSNRSNRYPDPTEPVENLSLSDERNLNPQKSGLLSDKWREHAIFNVKEPINLQESRCESRFKPHTSESVKSLGMGHLLTENRAAWPSSSETSSAMSNFKRNDFFSDNYHREPDISAQISGAIGSEFLNGPIEDQDNNLTHDNARVQKTESDHNKLVLKSNQSLINTQNERGTSSVEEDGFRGVFKNDGHFSFEGELKNRERLGFLENIVEPEAKDLSMSQIHTKNSVSHEGAGPLSNSLVQDPQNSQRASAGSDWRSPNMNLDGQQGDSKNVNCGNSAVIVYEFSDHSESESRNVGSHSHRPLTKSSQSGEAYTQKGRNILETADLVDRKHIRNILDPSKSENDVNFRGVQLAREDVDRPRRAFQTLKAKLTDIDHRFDELEGFLKGNHFSTSRSNIHAVSPATKRTNMRPKQSRNHITMQNSCDHAQSRSSELRSNIKYFILEPERTRSAPLKVGSLAAHDSAQIISELKNPQQDSQFRHPSPSYCGMVVEATNFPDTNLKSTAKENALNRFISSLLNSLRNWKHIQHSNNKLFGRELPTDDSYISRIKDENKEITVKGDQNCKLDDILANLESKDQSKEFSKQQGSIAKSIDSEEINTKSEVCNYLRIFANFSEEIEVKNKKLQRAVEKRNEYFEKDKSQQAKTIFIDNHAKIRKYVDEISNTELQKLINIKSIHVKNDKYKRMIRILRRAIIETDHLIKATDRERREFLREFGDKTQNTESSEVFELKIAFNLGGAIFAPNIFLEIANNIVIYHKKEHIDKAVSRILRPIESLYDFIRYKSNTEKKEEIIKFLLACLEKRSNKLFDEIDDAFKERSLIIEMYLKSSESVPVSMMKERLIDEFQEDFIKNLIQSIKNTNDDFMNNFVIMNSEIVAEYANLLNTGSKNSVENLKRMFKATFKDEQKNE